MLYLHFYCSEGISQEGFFRAIPKFMDGFENL
jgi:hypothetical protein